MALAGTRSMEFSAASHRGAFSAHFDGIKHGGVKGRRWQRRATIYLPSQGPSERGDGEFRRAWKFDDAFPIYLDGVMQVRRWLQRFQRHIGGGECLADLP